MKDAKCDNFKCKKYSFFDVQLSYKHRLSDIDWDLLEKIFKKVMGEHFFLQIHKTKSDDFEKLLKDFNKESNKIKEEFKKELK